VVQCPPLAPLHPAPDNRKSSVAITGGTGGLGLLMACWVASMGEVHTIKLISRTGSLPAAAPHTGLSAAGGLGPHALLQQQGVQVVVLAADVSTKEGAALVVQELVGVDAVLHAAGILQVGKGGCYVALVVGK
jgi:NAD(P)-dependent dehydrogenase (short-subunit alcohol dehydrogenase family)